MRKKKIELIDELRLVENLLLEKEEELITCQDELVRVQTKNAELQKKADTSHKELKAVQAALKKQKKAKKTVPTSSYSFRLDVYPRSEGTFQSRIEHLLSGERQPLDGLDVETMRDFIANYISEESPHIISESTEAIAPYFEPQLFTQAVSKDGILQSNIPFQLQIRIKPRAKPQKELTSVRCNVSVFAKDLGSGKLSLLGTLDEALIPTEEESTYMINSIGLPKGFYRIETVSTYTTQKGNTIPALSVQETSFFHIT